MWGKFKDLAMGKPMPFDIRTWGDVAASQNLLYRPLFRKAINARQVPVLKLLLQLPTRSNLHAYCNQGFEEGRSIIPNKYHTANFDLRRLEGGTRG